MVEGLGVMAIGTLIGYAGLRLLGEYRKAFFVDARTIMTLEVVLQVLRLGGPGYLAVLCLVGAVMLVAGGIFILLMEAFHHLARLWG